jgi:hypothetical protein
MQKFWERAIEFWLQWDSILSDGIPRTYPTEQRYRYRFPLLAIASEYRNPEYQYLALKDRFRISGEDVSDILGFDQRKAPEDEKGKTLRWFASPWEYLFYDDTLKPSEIRPRQKSICFPNLGRALIRSTWGENPSVLYFRSGPRIGKDHGDNNAFQLTVFGYKILPPLDMPEFPFKIRGVETMKEQDWRQSTFANNTIVVDDVRQHSLWARSQKRFISQKNAFGWLAQPEEHAEPQARIESYAFSPLIDYVCGDAGNAYYTHADERMLRHFRRHIFFVKTEYLVVYDDIVSADDTPRKIEWYYHAGSRKNALDVRGNNGFIISPARSSARVKLDTTIVFPAVSIEKKQVPSIMKGYDSDYVVFKAAQAKPQIACLCVMDIQKDDGAPKMITLVSNNAQCLILNVGNDTLIINKTEKPIRHNAMEFSGKAMWARPDTCAMLIDGLYLKQGGRELIRNQKKSSAFWRK